MVVAGAMSLPHVRHQRIRWLRPQKPLHGEAAAAPREVEWRVAVAQLWLWLPQLGGAQRAIPGPMPSALPESRCRAW